MLWHASDSVHALFENNIQVVNRLEWFYRFLHAGFLGVESKRSTHSMWWVRTILISAIGGVLGVVLIVVLNLLGISLAY